MPKKKKEAEVQKTKAKLKREAIESMREDQILTCVDMCDGHTIYKPSAFVARGLPEDAAELFADIHMSDGTAKGSIISDGKVVESLKGIYGLDFLKFVAWVLEVEYAGKMGRGFQALSIQDAIKKHFDKKKAEEEA